MLFELLLGGQSYWLALTAIKRHPSGDKKKNKLFSQFFQCHEIDLAYQWSQRHYEQKHDVYVRCTLLKARPRSGQRGNADATAGSNVLWVDVDKPVEEVFRHPFLKETPPTLAVRSGNGVHLYWELDQFETDCKAVVAVNKYLSRVLEGDDCYDIAHILRVPDTANYKDLQKPKPVEIIQQEHICYSIGDFLSAADPETKTEDTKNTDTVLETIELEPLPGEPPHHEEFLNKLGKTLRKHIVEGARTRDGKHNTDRSAQDWHTANQLDRLGYSEGQIASVLSHPLWASGRKGVEKGQGYILATLRAVRESKYKEQERVERYRLGKTLDNVFYTSDANGNKVRNKGLKGSDVVEPVRSELLAQGYRFFRDPIEAKGYLVTQDGQVLFADVNDTEYRDWLFNVSGYTAEEAEHRILRAGLASVARLQGSLAIPKPWIGLSSNGFSALVDLDGRHVLWTSVESSPNIITNGTTPRNENTEENENRGSEGFGERAPALLLQKSTQAAKIIHYDPKAKPTELKRLKDLFTDTLAVDSVLREVLTCYLLAAPLHRGVAVTTYPLLHLTGPSGGGKTQTLKLISTFFHGFPRLSNPTAAAFYRVASRELFMPFDDYDNLPQYLKDIILTSTTGIVRQKSSGKDDTTAQQAHVLMALTSTTALPDEMTRRRALVIETDKSRWPSDIPYNEEHWKLLAAERSVLMSAYVNWLHEVVLSKLREHSFKDYIRAHENQIPIDIFKGLAGYLSLMRFVGNLYYPMLGKSLKSFKRWVDALDIGTDEEVADRNPLLAAIHNVFEAYEALPGDQPEYFRDMNFRLHSSIASDNSISLSGTTTEWMMTLKQATRGQYKVDSVIALGFAFKRLLGRTPGKGVQIRKHGYEFERLKNFGNTNQNGWCITIYKEEP